MALCFETILFNTFNEPLILFLKLHIIIDLNLEVFMKEFSFIDKDNAIIIPSSFRNMFDKKVIVYIKNEKLFIIPL